MNERIRELADQAGIKMTPMVVDGVEYDLEDVDMEDSEDLERFAQLIVQECASMARVYCSHEFDFTGDLELDEFMLKHFGVE